MRDQTLLEQLQSAVIEPRDGGANWPSGLWTVEEVCADASERQSRILKDTGCLFSVAILPCLAGEPRVGLPTDWMRTLEVVYSGDDGTVKHLMRSDAFEVDHAIPTWSTDRQAPQVYMEYDTPTRLMQIAPIPQVAGTLTLLYVAIATPLTGDGTALVLPDLLAHAVKYGALADMLGKDGRAHDAERAAYAQHRFQLAVDVTRILLGGWA